MPNSVSVCSRWSIYIYLYIYLNIYIVIYTVYIYVIFLGGGDSICMYHFPHHFYTFCAFTSYMYICMVITYSKSMDPPGKVSNPGRGRLNRKNEYFPVRVRA